MSCHRKRVKKILNACQMFKKLNTGNHWTHENESYDLEDLKDDFSQIVSSIGTNEEGSMSFEIPQNYDVDAMISGIKGKKRSN